MRIEQQQFFLEIAVIFPASLTYFTLVTVAYKYFMLRLISLYSELLRYLRYKYAIFNSVRSTCKLQCYLYITKATVVSQHVTVMKFVQCHRRVHYFYTNKTNCRQIFVDKPDLKFKHFMATFDISLSDISNTRIPDLMGVSLP